MGGKRYIGLHIRVLGQRFGGVSGVLTYSLLDRKLSSD